MPFGIGPLELVIVLVIVLLIVGPRRLPGMGKALGTGMREFKESITPGSKDKGDDDDDRPTITAADGDASTTTARTERERAVDAS